MSDEATQCNEIIEAYFHNIHFNWRKIYFLKLNKRKFNYKNLNEKFRE